MNDARNKRQTVLICAVLAVLTLVVYARALHFEFVNYDDQAYVTENTHVQAGLTGAGIAWAFTTGDASNWHPLAWLSHMLDCQFYGLKPWGHHLTSILFHAANAVLVFLVLRLMTGAVWRSAVVAALFAWHPVHVESVAWVSERKDVLSAFFGLLTLGAYARYVLESKVQGPRSKVYYAATLVLFALALMSKPMMVTLPFVLLLLDFWPLGRVIDFKAAPATTSRNNRKSSPTVKAPSANPQSAIRNPQSLVVEKLPFFALSVASSIVTFFVQRKGGAVSSLNALSLQARLTNTVVSYLRYVGKIFWPQNLSVLYPHPRAWPIWLVAAAGLFVLGMTVWTVWQARRRPYLAVGWLWFLGMLVPVIGLVQVGLQSMADRYTYIPALGVFIMVCWGVPELLARWEQRDPVLGVAAGVVLAACLAVTFVQTGYWRNSGLLFQRASDVTTDNYLAYDNYGTWLSDHERYDEAIASYAHSLEINADYEKAQNNIGFALAKRGRYAEAIDHYKRALRIKPNLIEAMNNLGNAYSETGQLDEAIAQYEAAMKIDPSHADSHSNMGIALAMRGRMDEAMAHLTEAVRLKPTAASVHSNLGNALAMQKKFEEASAQYKIALELKPDDAQSYNNLANVYAEQQKTGEAMEYYRKALALKGENPEANYNLGLMLLRENQRDEALVHFREAVRLKPGYVDAQKQIDALSANRQ